MERYSLLKLSPALLLKKPLAPTTTNSLYKILESVADGKVKGIRVVAVDGAVKREYVVEKYQRYKAGLLGRVWLKRDGAHIRDHSQSDAKLIDDQEALGLKWHLKTQ